MIFVSDFSKEQPGSYRLLIVNRRTDKFIKEGISKVNKNIWKILNLCILEENDFKDNSEIIH